MAEDPEGPAGFIEEDLGEVQAQGAPVAEAAGGGLQGPGQAQALPRAQEVLALDRGGGRPPLDLDGHEAAGRIPGEEVDLAGAQAQAARQDAPAGGLEAPGRRVLGGAAALRPGVGGREGLHGPGGAPGSRPLQEAAAAGAFSFAAPASEPFSLEDAMRAMALRSTFSRTWSSTLRVRV